MNNVWITGRIIPNTEKSNKNYVYSPAQGDPNNGGKPSWVRFLLSVQKEGAPKDPKTGYYPTFPLRVVAFGATADQTHQYAGEGAKFGCCGVLMQDDPYVGEDGQTHYSPIYLKAQKIVYDCIARKEDGHTAPQANVATGAPATVTGGIQLNRKTTNTKTLKKPAAAVASPF